ncbi:MAG: OmpH family outer membrane protein [Alphaproteobacteria bacterium]|nr:OmpH family outer membrane protein [Alphaproteobacteria bacterium]
MLYRFLCIVWVILGFFDLQAFAYGDKGETRVAFFDPKIVWESVPSFHAPKKELEAMLNKLQKRYSGLEKVLREEGQALQKERVRLEESSSKKDQKADSVKQEDCVKKFEEQWDAFNQKVLKIQKTVESKKRCIGEVYEQANDSLQRLLETEIEALARKKSIQIILLKESIAYGLPSLNLTEDLIDALKAKPNPLLLTFEGCERLGDE